MIYLFAIPVLLFLIALVYGALRGRIRASPCCSAADPSKDLRMRGAFPDAPESDADAASPDGHSPS